MQLIHTKKKIVSLAIVTGAVFLLPLSFAAAQTSLYQEVHTSSNSGSQTSSYSSTGQNNTTVEVTSTTVINGEEYNYHFSTSSQNGVEHQVTIVDGIPVSTKTVVPVDSANGELSAEEYKTYEAWIINLMNLLNYLQQYVPTTF